MTRTNVVIGAAAGMGAALVPLLAPRGRLVLADRDVDHLESVAADLGGGVEALAVDLTAPADVDTLVATTGDLGALVVTAGLSPSMADGRRIFEVNLVGLARTLRAYEPSLGPGSVAVCFASMAGHMVPPDPEMDALLADPLSPTFYGDLVARGVDPDEPQFAYALSKRGVLCLVRRLAAGWGERGARVLSLSPGMVDTGMGQLENAHQPAMAEMVEQSALGRMARPEELTRVAAFLASDGASFMTGTDVLVDGGVIAALR